MRTSELRRRSGLRGRATLVGFVGAVVFLALASIAYACILRTGKLLVCSPPSRTFSSSTQCSKAVGTGGQSGYARFDSSGSTISVKARNLGSMPYAVLFRIPGSTRGCTSHDEVSSLSLLGLNAENKPNTVNGPKFFLNDLATPSTSVGRAQVCVIDQPDRITSQTVNVAVL